MPPSAHEASPAQATRPLTPDPGPALLLRSIDLVDADLERAEHELEAMLHSPVAVIPDVGRHVALAGGKRLRPILTLLCARAADFHDPCRTTVAAVAELLHTATLLHDDVVDAGEFRRGRPAARMVYGNGMAVLAGDYCLARALQAVARTGRLVAVKTLSDTVVRMAEGEVAQLDVAGDFTLDRERYYAVIDRKTAALIAWCSSVAGLVDEQFVEPLHRFGIELGHAFQIADDLLDYRVGEPGVPGKDPAQDLREGKMTLPLIAACEADPKLRGLVEDALGSGPPIAEGLVCRIVSDVLSSPGIAEARATAMNHAEQAARALNALPASPARDALVGITQYVVRRTH